MSQATPTTVQVSSQNDLQVSEARLRNILDKQHVNKDISLRIKTIKAELLPYLEEEKALESGKEKQTDASGKQLFMDNKKPALIPLTEEKRVAYTERRVKFAERKKVLVDELDALSNAKIRFSDNVSIVVSTYCEEVVKELADFAMSNCLLQESKIAKLAHLHTKGVEQLSLYPLIKDLPLWRSPPIEPVKVKKEPVAKGTEVPKAPKVPKEKSEKTSLVYYISEIFRELTHPVKYGTDGVPLMETVKNKKGEESKQESRVQDGKYHEIRVSTKLKEYLSSLLIESLAELSPVLQLELQARQIKTVSEATVVHIIKRKMIAGCESKDQLIYRKVSVPDPKVLKAQAEKKAEAKKNKTVATDLLTADQIPKIEVTRIEKETTYVCPGFDRLKKAIDARLEHYEKTKKEDAAKKEEASKKEEKPATV
jgi:hypothetical protein